MIPASCLTPAAALMAAALWMYTPGDAALAQTVSQRVKVNINIAKLHPDVHEIRVSCGTTHLPAQASGQVPEDMEWYTVNTEDASFVPVHCFNVDLGPN